MTYVVGIDVGSQSVKAVLVGESGATRATATAPCETHYPASGWAEQDPRRWEQAIVQSVRELRAAAGLHGAALERPDARVLRGHRAPPRSPPYVPRHPRRLLVRLRDIVDLFAEMGLGGEEIGVVGGGARSPLWLQIKADVTGRPVRVVSGETTSAGAAMLAGVASGFFADLPEAVARMVRIAGEPVLPRPETRECYEDAYGVYRRPYDGVEHALA
ncbi:MAG: FGGY-family carbohydrate kinase [Solirubrobacteraceae bacterium]